MVSHFLGVTLTIVGFIALVTPFTPGSWLMLIGLGILLDKTPAEVLALLKEKSAWLVRWLKKKEGMSPLLQFRREQSRRARNRPPSH